MNKSYRIITLTLWLTLLKYESSLFSSHVCPTLLTHFPPYFSGPLQNNNRQVYFHSLASVKECWTSTSVILNQTNFQNNVTPTKLFGISEGDRSSQSSSEVMNEEGILFFPLLKDNSLVCWNSKTTYRPENFVTLYKVTWGVRGVIHKAKPL